MAGYTANVTRDGRFWHIHVPEIDRVTQARTWDEVELTARDLIACITNADPAAIDLEVRGFDR